MNKGEIPESSPGNDSRPVRAAGAVKANSADPYEALYDLPHHVSDYHPHMSMTNRAAQFSPFKSMAGYEDEVKRAEEEWIRKINEADDHSGKRRHEMLPHDPAILFSLLNTKLRDFYPSLHALCDDLDEDEEEILRIMKDAGHTYDPAQNRFV